jgi:uncharacterized membrane protein YcjF (UPF0283 family)
MAGYFSFRKIITTYFVKTVYALGFILLTFAGIGLAVWASQRLSAATMPTRTAVYYIAAGVGIVLVGNLVWRMVCEFWLLLFDMRALLVSIEQEVRLADNQTQMNHEVVEAEMTRDDSRPHPSNYVVGSGHSVLGLS